MDANGVLAAVHDPDNHDLDTTLVGAAPAWVRSAKDANGVWADVFDPATGTLRVVVT